MSDNSPEERPPEGTPPPPPPAPAGPGWGQVPPPPPPPGYGAPGYGAPASSSTNGFAVASLVMGVGGLLSCGLTGVLALVFGYIARGQIRQRGEQGDGLAIAGIVLGWIWVGLLALGVVLGVLGAGRYSPAGP